MTPVEQARPRSAGMAFIFATIFLDVVGFGLIIPNTPALIARLAGTDISQSSLYYGLTSSLYTLVQFLCAPLLGSLSDRYGRKPVLLVALLASAASLLATAYAPSIGFLLLIRALGGVGAASMTVATTYIADVSPPEKRAQNFGMVGVAFGLGFITGPAIGGLLGNFDLRAPFLAAAAVCFANFLYGLFVVPESLDPASRREVSLANANPLSTLGMLAKYPLVLALAVALVWSTLSMQCLQNNWVPYTTFRYAWTPRDTGISLAVVGISAAVVQGGLIRPILKALGERQAILAGLAVNVAAMAAYGLAPMGWMMYPILLVGSLAGVAGPALQAQISKQVPSNEQGGVQGALTSLNSLTGIVGPMLANGAFGYFTSKQAPFPLPGAAFLLGALLAFVALVLVVRVFANHPEATPEGVIG